MTELESVHDATANSLRDSTVSYSRSNAQIGEFDNGLSTFLDMRRKLFGIAFRMLRSAAEAEDIVQEVWLRWQTTNRGVVHDPPAFLVTITTRMCINFCQSARARRETYIDTWLPEPLDSNNDPCRDAERKEAMKSAVRMLLEKLRPSERAAFVLREAFSYSSRQIADVLQIKETNVRQLLTRARIRVTGGYRATSSAAERQRLLTTLVDAAHNGNLADMEELFVAAICSDIVSQNDGVSCLGRHKSQLRRLRSKQCNGHKEVESSSRCLMQQCSFFVQQAPSASKPLTACLS
jgi:RNA polymerase sigma factor (sigma-70 family)